MSKIDKKVLIVEDEEILANVLRDQLELAGFSVAMASNGEEGLIQVTKEKPDLILLDILMPKMGGIEMARELRNRGKDIPIIILTNLESVQHVSDAVALGPYDYFIKADWKLKDIIKRVKEKLFVKV